MTETSRAQCPACGANIEDDGRIKVIECAYCRTKVTIRREPAPPPAPPKPGPAGRARGWPVEEPERPQVRVQLSPAFEDEARETAKGLRRGWGFVFLAGLVSGALVYLVYFCVATDFGSNLAPWKGEAWLALIPAGVAAFFAALFTTIYFLMTD